MATITNRKLTVRHDHEKKTVLATVTCNVNFTALELCQMKNCTAARHFKLKCQLWGEDDSFFDPTDNLLYTYGNAFYFPDGTPTATETRKFEVLLGEGVLDEDWLGRDEVYGLLRLSNLNAMTEIKKKTNTVEHHF